MARKRRVEAALDVLRSMALRTLSLNLLLKSQVALSINWLKQINEKYY